MVFPSGRRPFDLRLDQMLGCSIVISDSPGPLPDPEAFPFVASVVKTVVFIWSAIAGVPHNERHEFQSRLVRQHEQRLLREDVEMVRLMTTVDGFTRIFQVDSIGSQGADAEKAALARRLGERSKKLARIFDVFDDVLANDQIVFACEDGRIVELS